MTNKDIAKLKDGSKIRVWIRNYPRPKIRVLKFHYDGFTVYDLKGVRRAFFHLSVESVFDGYTRVELISP